MINQKQKNIAVSDRIKTADHYTHGKLLDAILSGLKELGKAPDSVTVEDLAPIDEFHIGGRGATIDLLEQLKFSAAHHILDIGCGLGGTVRYVAARYKSRVTGIDLTAEYIDTGKVLSTWTGLDDRIALYQGSALSIPFGNSSFNGAVMMHVGMNIVDKAGLFTEAWRVLARGALFGIYDVMRLGEGDLFYPVPWAIKAAASAVATPGQYKEALQKAGFTIISERNRHEFAVGFFKQVAMQSATAGKQKRLGLHILMGQDAAIKSKNMIANVSAGLLAPVEIIARKA